MMRKVVDERVEVRGPDYSSEVWDFVEVDALKYFSESLKNQHLEELVVSPVSTTKPFIRLSDLRFLSSLFLHNFRHSVMRGGSIILEMLMLLSIPIFMHSLSDKDSIDRSFVLAKVINGGDGIRKKHTENYDKFPYDCFLLFERFFSFRRNEEGRVPVPYYLGSNKEISISADSSEEEMSIRYDDVTTPLLPGIWKARITKDFFGGDRFKYESEEIQVVGGGRLLKDLLMFFKSYKQVIVSKSGSDCHPNNLESPPLCKIRNRQDLGRLQAIWLGNNSSSPVVLDSCKRALLESADSADRRGDESPFSSEQEAFSNLSLFMSHEKTKLFCNSISELDYQEDKKVFPVLYAYPQVSNPLINRLTDFLLIIGKSNLLWGGERNIYVSTSIKSEKGFSPSEMGTNMPFTKIPRKKLRLASSGYFDFDHILPNCFKTSLKIPKKTTNRNEITNFLNKLEGGGNLDSRYSPVRLYGQNRIIPICFTYISLLHDYFCTLSTEYLSRLKYWLDGCTVGGEYTSLTRIATEQTVFKWKDDVECLSNEYVTFQIGECKNVQSNMHKWLNATANLSPVGKFLGKTMKYELEDLICRMSIVGDGLLSTTGVSLRSTNRHTKRYLHRFLNVLFLSEIIVAEAIRHKGMIDTIAYCIEKLDDIDVETLNKMDHIECDSFSGLTEGYQILSFKKTLEERRSFLVGFKPLTNQQSIGSSTALKPASNPTFLGLPRIEAIRAGFSSEALSIMGRQFWNLFLYDLGRDGNPIRDISGGIPKNISDQMNERNHSPIRTRSGNNFIPKIEGGFLVRNCSSSYLNVLENFFVGSDEKAISPDIISLIHPQLSDSLLSKFSKQTVGEVSGHLLTLIRFMSPNLHKSATIVTHLDGLRNSILPLNGLLASLSSSPGKATDSFLSWCSNDGVSLGEASVNSDSWSDHHRTQPGRNLVLDRFNSERFVKDGLDPGNDSTGNRVHQNGLSIEYFWEPEELDTPYWSLRFSLCNDVTSIFIARPFGFGEEVLRKDVGFADSSAREKNNRPLHFINFNEVSKDLNRYKISWIFWKDSIAKKWGLLRDYIPLFFTPTWWRYFCALIGETYPEIVLKISYDSNHDLPKIFGGIARDLVSGTKGYLLQSLQRLGLRFGSHSIHTIPSETDLLILRKIPNKAEILHPGEWSVSQFSNRPIFYCYILSLLCVLASLKHPLSAVSGSNSFHLWKRFDTIEYLTDPMRRSYLKKVMYSPPISQMVTRDLLIHYLNRFLNHVSNLIFFLLVKNELDSWIFRRESSDILESKKELLTQHLVTAHILYRYASRSKSNSDLLSNKIFHEPYLQGRSNVLAYLLQFWQNDLLGHKIRKLDPAEKWAFSALERNIVFPTTTRRRENLLNMPCRDIPISLQSGLLLPKGILLVGPVETGRSSIIRDVAFNSYFPLVKLPLKKLIYNRSFFRFRNVRGNFISKESVHRLDIVFEIAREMSPCTLWIQDIHELNICRSYNKLEADPKFLLCRILKSIGHKLGNSDIRATVVIATTHVPARIDPALVAPNRLSQLINLRKFNGRQRQKKLSILLRIKGFEVGANPSLLESTVSETAGYSKRDFFFLANEALLIGTSKREKFLCGNAIGLALHRQHSTVSDMGNGMESDSEWEISSYKMAEATPRNSLIDLYLTNIPFIGRDASKMRFYYLSNWYVEPLRNESTIDEFTMFSQLLEVLAKLVAHDSFKMDMEKRENLMVLNKLVENDLNLACGILENLPTKFSSPEICKAGSQRSNSFPTPFPIGKPKFCPSVTSPSRSSKSMRRRRLSSLTDFEMQQLPELRNSTTEISREITWSRKSWRLRFLRSGTYQLMGVLSEPNHLYNLILLCYNQNYISQQDLEFNKIKGAKTKWREKDGYLFSFEKSVTDGTDNSIKRLENRLDNLLLREQFLELGIYGDSSNEYETHCNRSHETTRLFGGRFIWDPMLLFQPDPNIPPPRRNLLSTKELARRLHTIYGMRRQRLHKMSNKKIKDFFLYREDNPKLKPDYRWKNLPLDEEERDPGYIRETSSVDIHLQYPQLFTPVRLGCYAVAEDFPERFIRFRLLAHRSKWITRNRYPSRDFLIYNILLETYEYLSNPFRFGKAALDRTMKQFLHESSMS
uniref:photosystem I assembly protein ycf2 n=1 Tax=Haplopteris ensiformis TaxID=38644 RepID=UPI0021823A45|nr:photosystem I assembly protein ycf2 [Haplopteris ensiformis]UQV94566.1 photosystem I assembly protein ycf2 [Haplopteris ensiformis]